MGVLRRFAVPADCVDCRLRTKGDFCHLPQEPLQMLSRAGHVTMYPSAAPLLTEGLTPHGVYIVCSGRVKLSVETRDGKTVILKIADNRYVLGLSAIISGRPSPITATTIELCQIKYVERENFFRLIESDGRILLMCASMLASEVSTTFGDVYELLLARSSTEKLARLLLSWVAGEPRNRELRVPSEFTHEEMAQMIGSSRETVTRLLTDMRRKELIRIEGATLVIPNRIALQAIA
jgi:CRP/FNR family cyclic AMP-dependent transcriptional regulator